MTLHSAVAPIYAVMYFWAEKGTMREITQHSDPQPGLEPELFDHKSNELMLLLITYTGIGVSKMSYSHLFLGS